MEDVTGDASRPRSRCARARAVPRRLRSHRDGHVRDRCGDSAYRLHQPRIPAALVGLSSGGDGSTGMPLGDLLTRTEGAEEGHALSAGSWNVRQSELRRHLSLRPKVMREEEGREVLAEAWACCRGGRPSSFPSSTSPRATGIRERELEKRARQLSDFLGIASHELRHPITLIRGYARDLAGSMERRAGRSG